MLDLVIDATAIWLLTAIACVAVDLIPALRRDPVAEEATPQVKNRRLIHERRTHGSQQPTPSPQPSSNTNQQGA